MHVFAHKYLGLHFYTLSFVVQRQLWVMQANLGAIGLGAGIHTPGHAHTWTCKPGGYRFGCRHYTHLDMRLQEQEGENETISSDSGKKWCGILGKEEKVFSNRRPGYSKDDLLFERDLARLLLWPLHAFALFLLLSWKFFGDFFPRLGYYLPRHTCV